MKLLRVRNCLAVLGLGVLAGAVFPASLRAQVPVRRDTVASMRISPRGRTMVCRAVMDEMRRVTVTPIPNETRAIHYCV